MTDEERVEAIARVIMTAWGWSKPAFDDPIHALTRRNAERVARSIIAADPLTAEVKAKDTEIVALTEIADEKDQLEADLEALTAEHTQLKADVVEIIGAFNAIAENREIMVYRGGHRDWNRLVTLMGKQSALLDRLRGGVT